MAARSRRARDRGARLLHHPQPQRAAGRGQDINETYIIPHFVRDFGLSLVAPPSAVISYRLLYPTPNDVALAPDAVIAAVVAEGRPGMPAVTLTADEQARLIAYLRYLQGL